MERETLYARLNEVLALMPDDDAPAAADAIKSLLAELKREEYLGLDRAGL